MATIAHALTTKARIIQNIQNYKPVFDSLIDELINSATDFFELQCSGRRFLETTYTNEMYDGYNRFGSYRSCIRLKNFPIGALTSFQYKSGDTWLDVTASDYFFDSEAGLIRMINVNIPGGWNNIRITYTAGYLIDFDSADNAVLHTLPFDISQAVERLVLNNFLNRKHLGRASTSSSGSTISMLSDLDKQVLLTIARYTIIEV